MSEALEKPKRPRGRPTKFSREKAESIFEALRFGCTRKAAAESVGIHYQTFNAWINGESTLIEPEDIRYFSEGVEQAEAHAEKEFTKCWAAHAPRDWRAAEAWLKRRRSKDYGDRTELTVTFSPEQLKELPDQELDRLIEAASVH